MRGRSPDYSPRRSYDSPPRRGYESPPRRGYESPPRRGYGGRRRSPSPLPRGGRGGYDREPERPTSLLVRNIPRDCSAEDLRIPFERYGVVKDVYLPRDYYTSYTVEVGTKCSAHSKYFWKNLLQEPFEIRMKSSVSIICSHWGHMLTSRQPRGFGFVQFLEPREASEAQYYLDHSLLAGREITVVFAEENRKRPQEMRSKERFRGRPGFGTRRGSRSPRRFTPSPRGGRRSRSPSRSGRAYRRRSYTHSPGQHDIAPSRSPSPLTSHRETRDRSPVWRSPSPPSRSRGSQLRANGRDQYEPRSRSPVGSPVAPHRRRRSPSPDERMPQDAAFNRSSPVW